MNRTYGRSAIMAAALLLLIFSAPLPASQTARGAQKDLTTQCAMDVEGVKDVRNEMTVAGAAKKTRTAGQKIDDASITAQVKQIRIFRTK